MKILLLFFSGMPLGAFPQDQLADPTKEPSTYQIIISEIMADPNPCVRLPNAEYIELFNRGTSAVNLEGWQLILGTHIKILSADTVEPGDYLILCENGDEDMFQVYGNILPVQNMPAIVNSGQTLTLKSPLGAVIHTVTFSPEWYKTRLKSEGGWSLEIIDPDNPCGFSENWAESRDPQGGTPGKKNSMDARNPDVLSPLLLRATLPSDSAVLLLFSERMDRATLNSPWSYSVSDGLMHPDRVDPTEPDFTTVLLTYPQSFRSSIQYTVAVLNSLQDCTGNPIAPDAVINFAIPEDPAGHDVIFNEVLFNPLPERAEFIELYNRSTKVLDLSDFTIAHTDLQSGDRMHSVSLKNSPYLLFPGNYVVITNHSKGLPGRCLSDYPGMIVEPDEWFALPDEEGRLILLDDLSRIVDEFHYAESMHTHFLHDTEGVSLERADPDQLTDSQQNWHSASTADGYSTPCRANSQAIYHNYTQGEVTLQPEVFSPDNDGVDDYVTLHLKNNEPGCMATITVFNIYGERIRDLASRVLLGTNEHLTWDGTSNDLSPAEMGIFIVYVEIVNPTGKVKKIKKVVTLTRRL